MSETENKKPINDGAMTNESILDEEFPLDEEKEKAEKQVIKKTSSGRKTDCYVGYHWPPGC